MTPNQKALQLEERLIDFSVRILNVAEELPASFAGKYFGGQIVRSGSAPALIYGEARSAESRKDFRHKLSLVLKELRETHINLRIIEKKSYLSTEKLANIIDESNQLVSIFSATVKSVSSGENKRLSGGYYFLRQPNPTSNVKPPTSTVPTP